MESIHLRGGDVHITNDSAMAYEVVQGHVLVYLFPYRKGKTGRKLFLLEAVPGEMLPSLCSETEDMGAWRIGLAALEEAVLRPLSGKADDGLKESFAKRAGVYLPDAGGFEEQLIEAYNIQLIKEEGYIYATAKEQENTYEKSLRIILDLFQGKNSRKAMPESGNRIYDGVAYLCSQMNIPVASYDKIVENCGRKFTIEDIARISHFIIREVVLEEKWYTKDSGPLLVYTDRGKDRKSTRLNSSH